MLDQKGVGLHQLSEQEKEEAKSLLREIQNSNSRELEHFKDKIISIERKMDKLINLTKQKKGRF